MRTRRVLIVLLGVTLLTACGGQAAPSAGSGGKPFRIAVVMPSATTDVAFSQSMWSALKSVQTEMGGASALELV